MTERRATIAATPTAMQTKKNNRRRHDERVSRAAMRRMNRIYVCSEGPPSALRRCARRRSDTYVGSRCFHLVDDASITQHETRIGHGGELGIVRHQDDGRAARPVN